MGIAEDVDREAPPAYSHRWPDVLCGVGGVVAIVAGLAGSVWVFLEAFSCIDEAHVGPYCVGNQSLGIFLGGPFVIGLGVGALIVAGRWGPKRRLSPVRRTGVVLGGVVCLAGVFAIVGTIGAYGWCLGHNLTCAEYPAWLMVIVGGLVVILGAAVAFASRTRTLV